MKRILVLPKEHIVIPAKFGDKVGVAVNSKEYKEGYTYFFAEGNDMPVMLMYIMDSNDECVPYDFTWKEAIRLKVPLVPCVFADYLFEPNVLASSVLFEYGSYEAIVEPLLVEKVDESELLTEEDLDDFDIHTGDLEDFEEDFIDLEEDSE